MDRTWAEQLKIISFSLFSLILLLFFHACIRLKKKLFKGILKNELYVRVKENVAQCLKEKEKEASATRFDVIQEATKRVIVHRLVKTGGKWCCNKQICKDEESLRGLMKDLVKKILEKSPDDDMVIKALTFKLKSQTMRHPFEIVRSRRASVMIEKLHEVMNQKQKQTGCFCLSRQECTNTIEDKNCGYWNSKQLMLLIISFVCIVVNFFGVYFFDSFTDILLLAQNYQLFSIVWSSLESFENSTIDGHSISIPRMSFVISLPWRFLTLLLLISTYLTVTKMGCLKHLLQVDCSMKDPNFEKSGDEIKIESVITRYDAHLEESVTESLIQVIFQWGSYMGLIYLIDRTAMYLKFGNIDESCNTEQPTTQLFNSSEYLDTLPLLSSFHDSICNLNEQVAFARKKSLWISGFFGMVSLTLAQLKSNNTQHEFSISREMKAAYLIAALMNTVSYTTLLISCYASFIDFVSLILDCLEYQKWNVFALIMFGFLVCASLSVFICFIAFLARYLVFRNLRSYEKKFLFHFQPHNGRIKRVLPNCLFSLWLEIKHLLRNTLKFFQLPTSLFSYDHRYIFYQSQYSKKNIKCFMVQVLMYVFFMMYNLMLMGMTAMIRGSVDNALLNYAPSDASLSRQNFAIFTSIVVPTGWGLSYLFLWIYFKLDKGFFSSTNMRFTFKDETTWEHAVGEWEDFNECEVEQ